MNCTLVDEEDHQPMARKKGEQKRTGWAWTAARLEAAQLLAEDELTDREIADKVGIGRTALWEWKQVPEFAARVKEVADQLGATALRYGIARKARRVAALDDRWQRLLRVIEERAKAKEMKGAPGGRTGLLARVLRMIGGGEHGREVEEFELDAALLKELREHEKQAAQELGQWTEKQEVTGGGGGPVVVKVLGPGQAMADL